MRTDAEFRRESNASFFWGIVAGVVIGVWAAHLWRML